MNGTGLSDVYHLYPKEDLIEDILYDELLMPL